MSEYTVKQMAAELSVSKPTVQKVINDLQIVPLRIVNNKYRIYAAADLERIAEVLRMKTLQKDTAKPQSDAEKLKNETENEIEKPKTDCENTAKPQSDAEKLKNTDGMSEVKALYLVIDTLQKQIEELKADKAFLQKSLDQEQQLNAMSHKKVMALENQLKSKEQKQPENEVVSEVADPAVDPQPEDPDQEAAAVRTEESVKGRWWKRLWKR